MPTSIRCTILAPAMAVLFFAACGGKTSGVYPGGSSGGSSGGSAGSSSGSTGGGSSSGGGSLGSPGPSSSSTSSSGGSSSSTDPMCVDINPSSFDQSCNQNSDCVGVASGAFCTGDCFCPDAAINGSGYSQYQAEISSIMPGLCGCPAESPPACSGHTCVPCDQGPDNPPECQEGPDASVAIEASTGACVDIDVTTYDQSCQSDSDCVEITAGQICTDGCLCGGSTINASGLPRYDAAIGSIGNTLACPCASNGHPVCSPARAPGAKAMCFLCPPGADCVSVGPDGG